MEMQKSNWTLACEALRLERTSQQSQKNHVLISHEIVPKAEGRQGREAEGRPTGIGPKTEMASVDKRLRRIGHAESPGIMEK